MSKIFSKAQSVLSFSSTSD